MKRRRRLGILASAHVVLALVTGAAIFYKVATPVGLPHVLIVLPWAQTLCLIVLLGIWTIFSKAADGRRLAVSAAGLAVLECLFLLILDGEFAAMPPMILVLIAGTLIGVYNMGYKVERPTIPVDSIRASSWAPRFSIRGLMILTAAVALLGAPLKTLREGTGPTGPAFLGVAVYWSVGVAAVGLLALWAGLGLAPPTARALGVCVFSLVIGGLVAFAMEVDLVGLVYLALIMLLYAALLVGSLIVVRSCGYRFWKPEGAAPPDPAGETAVGVLAD